MGGDIYPPKKTPITASNGDTIESQNGSLKVKDYVAVAVNDGRYFFNAQRFTLLNTENKLFLITTGAAQVLLDSAMSVTGNTAVDFFEAPTVTDDGTTVPLINSNRDSGNTPTVALFSEPTITVNGLEISKGLIHGGEKSKTFGGSRDVDIPVVSKPSTSYFMKITNTSGATGIISINFTFIEQEIL